MASPSGRKEGLRCQCGKLLLEINPETGELGVRCGRDDCRKFHPLEKINQKAVEFERRRKEEKMFGSAPNNIEEEKKNIFHTFELLRRYGQLIGRRNIKEIREVRYFFTYDGSNDEVDVIAKDEPRRLLSTYHPNQKISRRLENELPLKIVFIFRGWDSTKLVLEVSQYSGGW